MTKLSIIIPVYQVKPYLPRCLNSVLSQTFIDYEVILVDDGSTDGSQDICDTYAERYDTFSVIHKQNGGLSSARNAGLEVASGEYIMFVDADDIIHSKAAEIEITFLEKHNLDALICPLRRFKKDERIDNLSPVELPIEPTFISGLEAVEGVLGNGIDVSKYVSSCGKVFRRVLFEDIRFPEGRLFEDEYTTYRLYYKCNRVGIIDTALYFYFVNDGGITQNLNVDRRFDEYDAQIERIEFFKNADLQDLYHQGLLVFLKTAQWDLKICQEGKREFNPDRAKVFQKQYSSAVDQADKEGIISFVNDYDFYVLGFPEKKTLFRIKRKLFKLMGKM